MNGKKLSGKESIRALAFVIYQVKSRQGIPNTPQENWEEAKNILSGLPMTQLQKVIELIFKIVCVFGDEGGKWST